MLDGIFVVLVNIIRMRINIMHMMYCKYVFMEDYQCWNKHGKEGLNEADMRDLYLEREVLSVPLQHGSKLVEHPLTAEPVSGLWILHQPIDVPPDGAASWSDRSCGLGWASSPASTPV
jgi:hypothetical protein